MRTPTYRPIDVKRLRAITNATTVLMPGKKPIDPRFQSLGKLKAVLEEMKEFQLAQNILDSLPVVCEISARERGSSAVVMKLASADFKIPEDLPGSFRDEDARIEWTIGVPNLVFKVLQKEGLAPTLKHVPSSSMASRPNCYSHWVIEIHW